MLNQWIILATTLDQLTSATRYLSRRSTSRETLIFILFAVVIATIWGTLFLLDRVRKFHGDVPETVRSLFDELCAAHRLSQQEIVSLVDAAKECQLASAAPLFVQPEHLDWLSGEHRPQAEIYKGLREKLFGKN